MGTISFVQDRKRWLTSVKTCPTAVLMNYRKHELVEVCPKEGDHTVLFPTPVGPMTLKILDKRPLEHPGEEEAYRMIVSLGLGSEISLTSRWDQ